MDFTVVPLNPIKFIDPRLGKFDGQSYIDLVNKFQESVCFFQKWQQTDSTTIQFLSDYSIEFSVVDLETNSTVASLVPLEIPTALSNQTFKVYEVYINFQTLGLPSGFYGFKVEYVDVNLNDVVLWSEPIDLQDEHEATMLVSYKNSENNFSVIFHEDLEFNIRVDGVIANFSPGADDIIYNDQKRNATMLDSVPYRIFTLFVGNETGVPDWFADKMNRIMSCDSIKIEGDHYQKIDGAKWDIKRIDGYPFSGLSIEIMPVENRFLYKYKNLSGDLLEPSEFIIVQKNKNYEDLSGSLSVLGEFKNKTLLEKICIVRTGTTFNLSVGTTPGGTEIGIFQISDLITTILINKLFTEPENIYLTGITAVSFLSLIYKQLDEKPKTIASSGGSSDPLPNITAIYTPGNLEELELNFDMSTGVGRAETPWIGWFIADGRNGTVNMGGYVPIGFDASNYPNLGVEVGADSITITEAHIPKHSFKVAADDTASQPNISSSNVLARSRTGGGNSDANLGGSTKDATLGKTNTYGADSPTAISLQQKSRVVLWVQKISQ